jgi:hypothetical protein
MIRNCADECPALFDGMCSMGDDLRNNITFARR